MPAPEVPTPPIPGGKIARIGAILLAILVVLYEGGVNLALQQHWIPRLVSRDAASLRLDYGKASTVAPGRVHVEGLDVRGRASTLEWELHIDAADADISLRAFFSRTFRVTKVTATGVSFRLRFRVDPRTANEDRVARMPVIEGFERVPRLGVPESKVGSGGPWTIDIEGADAFADEVWIDGVRLRGALEARGGFTLTGDRLALAPSTANVGGATLSTGGDPMATDLVGTVDAQIDPVSLDDVTGFGVLRYLSMHSVMKGQTGDLRYLRHFLHGPFAIAGGVGPFHGETRIERGVLIEGTGSHADMGPVTLTTADRTVEGRPHLDFAMGTEAQLDVAMADLTVSDASVATIVATCKSLAATARLPKIDLAEPAQSIERLTYSWSAPRADLADVHTLDAFIPKHSPFHIERGAATASVAGKGSLEGLTADVAMDSTVTMRIGAARVTSHVKGTIPFLAVFAGRTMDLAGTSLTFDEAAHAGWWAKVDLGTANVHVGPPSVALALTMSARDGIPFLDAYGSASKSSFLAEAGIFLLRNPLTEAMVKGLHGTVRLSASRGAFDLEELDVKGSASHLRARLASKGAELDGGFLVDAALTTFGVELAGGKTRVVVIEPNKWWDTLARPRSAAVR